MAPASIQLALAAAVASAPVVPAPIVAPWTEAVVSVRDLDRASALLRDVGGWRMVARGAMMQGELRYWGLPASARGSFQKVCAPASTSGCIRFVRFTGVAQRPIRLAARAWDTGGIYSIMVRSNDVQHLFDRAIGHGWWAESEPIAFRFGGSDLRNVVLQGPDGFQIAAYERRSPPFTAFPVGAISQGFNSMRMVRDAGAAIAYYRGTLGFGPVFDSDYRDPTPGPNNFSLPQNLTTSVVRRASALQPVPGETGRIEVMQFVGLKGKDMSQYADAPNLGILSVRYPVTGLAAFRERLPTPAHAADRVAIGGLGTVAIVASRDPDGNLTEWYEPQ